MRHVAGAIACTLALLVIAAPAAAQRRTRPAAEPAAPAAAATGYDSTLFNGLRWRSVGPYRGGRVTAVAGVSSQAHTYYFGATGGGVWKTTDAGMRWTPIADSILGAGSIGAIEVAPSDPNVIYVGGGEPCIRGNTSPGDGMYRSTDAGRTWTHIGLEDAGQIATIRIHPRDPDLVYVAVLGHAFGPNPTRGIFRSRDGGRTWQKVLFRSDSAGAIDLAMDPQNPRILYAALWQAVRHPWEMISGGPGSGLFRSTDGGDTWTEISRNAGLPRGVLGRIGVAVSYQNSDRVWAIVEAEDGGVFRSDDAGRTWTRTSEDRNLRQRAWYYSHIYADPAGNDGLYVLNVQFFRSGDGGRTFRTVSVPHGDNHGLWIDPADPDRMINGNDGGATVSENRGVSWSTIENQPTAQFYHVVATNDFPYRICGAQQDNSTICIPSRTSGGGIGRETWQILGGCESGYIAVRPDTTAISYAGCYGGQLDRQDARIEQERSINVWPENPMGYGGAQMRHRFQWTFPIVLSPHDPNTLYVGGERVFRSTDEGQSWTAISPDLTRNDTTKGRPSGGPITKDNTGVETYAVVFTIAPSPRERGVIWAGSDDGYVQVTRDGGRTWQNVTPPGIPDWATISLIEASPFDAATAYVAAQRSRMDDFAPYIYRTTDYGRTWTRITRGIPATHFIRVVREDPERRGLLYAGGEFGAYVSFDDGANWQSLRLNLPVVPVHDLVVKGSDLIAATHGRSFWVLDDLTALRTLDTTVARADVHLFQPRDVVRYGGSGFGRGDDGSGRNPVGGAVVYAYFKTRPDTGSAVTLDFLDSTGVLIRSYTTRRAPGADTLQVAKVPLDSIRQGMNRFAWNLRYPDAVSFAGLIMWAGGVTGPLATPGRYQVRLTVNGRSQTREFRSVPDPRVRTSPADFAAQFAFVIRVRDRLSDANGAVVRIRALKDQIEQVRARLADQANAAAIRAQADTLRQHLSAVEEEIYQVRNRSSQDPLNYPIKLNNKIAALMGVAASADARPTDQSLTVFEELSAALQVQLDRLSRIVDAEVPAFNQLVREANIPALVARQR